VDAVMVVAMFVVEGEMVFAPLVPVVVIVARTVYCPTTSGRKKVRPAS
jgi:hypothetical protein